MDRKAPEDVPAAAADWLRRPFARTFDLISKEYGWKDSEILDLTMARMRQVRDVILTRQDEDFQRDVRIEEAKVQAQMIAVYAAAGNEAGVKAAAKFRLLKRAEDADEEPPDTDSLPDTSAVIGALGGGGLPAYTEEQIAAEAERLRAEAQEPPEVRWEVKRRAE